MNYSAVLQLGWGWTGAGTIFLNELVRCVCASVGPCSIHNTISTAVYFLIPLCYIHIV